MKQNSEDKELDSLMKKILSKMGITEKKTVKHSGFSGYLKGLKEKKVDGKICGAPTKEVEICCASPKLITDPNIMQTCIRKHSAKTENNNGEIKQQNQVDKVRCSMQCAFDALGYLGSNGTILKDKVISALKSYATNDFWLKYVPEAVEACNKRLNAKKDKTSARQESKCPPDAKQFQTCIRQSFFINCPTENFAVDKSCEELRKNMIACDPFSTVNMNKTKMNHPRNKMATNSGIKLSNRKMQQKKKQVTPAPSDGQSRTAEATGNTKVANIKHKAKRIKILVKTTVSPTGKGSPSNKGNFKKISKKI
ncbi:hypothetical protein B566_EDAN009465 [Ephemera danica]|nr:hypothetical protein B566_EDAN009465 [Ephemera danica]